MNIALRTAALPAVNWSRDAKMVSLVRRTAAKDCNPDEFDLFVSVARELNLNPLRKQIYAFVFDKNDAERRNMSLVIGIDAFAGAVPAPRHAGAARKRAGRGGIVRQAPTEQIIGR